MIRAWDGVVDNRVLHPIYQRFRDQEVVDPSADTALAGIEDIRPPGVLDSIWVEMAINIDKAVIQKFLHPSPLFREKAGIFLVRFWVFQIDWHVRGIEITSNNQRLSLFVQTLADFQQFGIEIQFEINPLAAARPTRKVNIKESEVWMCGRNEAPLHVEAL